MRLAFSISSPALDRGTQLLTEAILLVTVYLAPKFKLVGETFMKRLYFSIDGCQFVSDPLTLEKAREVESVLKTCGIVCRSADGNLTVVVTSEAERAAVMVESFLRLGKDSIGQ